MTALFEYSGSVHPPRDICFYSDRTSFTEEILYSKVTVHRHLLELLGIIICLLEQSKRKESDNYVYMLQMMTGAYICYFSVCVILCNIT